MNNVLLNRVVEEFKHYIKKDIDNYDCEKIVKDALEYVLISDGKYIRPLILLSLFENTDQSKDYFDIALSIEMIHTYSLIHDDLPAMDNDNFRRGKLTLHKKFREDIAILTGDALLTHAFDKILDSSKLTDKKKIAVLKQLTLAAGINQGMINGQVLDVLNENIQKSQDLNEIHKQKTGKLIALPFIIYAIINNKNIEKYSFLGLEIGLLYQIQDDFFDKYGDEKILGKALQKDEKKGKKNYAFFNDKTELEHLIQEKKKKIKIILKNEKTSENSKQLVDRILERNK